MGLSFFCKWSKFFFTISFSFNALRDMGTVEHKILPSIHLLSILKISNPTLSSYLNWLVTLRKNTFLFKSTLAFTIISFEFNFLFIKISVGEILVVLCVVILYVNKNVFSFSFKLTDTSVFLKVFLKVLTSFSAHPFVAGWEGQICYVKCGSFS